MNTRIEEGVSSSLITLTTKAPPNRVRDRLQTGTPKAISVDVAALERELRTGIQGDVCFEGGDRGLYASDASNYRMVPIGVVLPKDADDVPRALAACRLHGAPVVARGGGTGMPGQTVNVAVVMDFSRYMNRLLEFDGSQICASAAGDLAGRVWP